jgi:hypothetical protein
MTTITHTAINPDTLETGPVVDWPKGVTHADALLAALEEIARGHMVMSVAAEYARAAIAAAKGADQ